MTNNRDPYGDTVVLEPEREPALTDDLDGHRSVSNTSEDDGAEENVTDEPAFGSEAAPTTPATSELELDDRGVRSAVAAVPTLDAALADASRIDVERAMESMTPEVVIGEDDRVRIDPTTSFPWRAICSLRITAKDDTNWIGTGFLVGPRVVVTAGHVVYLRNHGGWAEEIEVIPGRNGVQQPFDSCTSSHFHSVRGWTNGSDRDHDYGAVILPADCRFGDRVGWFGYASLSTSNLRNLVVNLSGYPGDKGGTTQWWHARRLSSVSGTRLRYNIDTAGGESGAPVWRLRNGQRHVVGIHTTGHSSGNGATRINGAVFDRIRSWKNLHQ